MILSLLQQDSQVISSLVWTLIHSVWQFGVIALLMSILLKMYQKQKSTLKYYIALGSLALSFLTAIVTFCYYYYSNTVQDLTVFIHDTSNFTSAASPENSLLLSIKLYIDQYQLPVFYTWVIGVAFFAIRFIMSVIYVEFLNFI